MATQALSKKTFASDGAISRRRINKVKLNVFFDLLLTVVFVVEMEEHFTGLALHELLGLFFAAAFALHIVLHWDWIVSITRTFFRKLLHESRVNYLLNVILFADMMFVTVSGILISRTLGLSLSLGDAFKRTLQSLHMVGAELVLIIVALHVAMHWKWIMTNGAKYLFGWLPKIAARLK
ncbi:MAG: DUF4405 domain-containing protein [Anaerolineae bacterium]|nr:DUF4405 domain-containing protein [Anaerolineae bacterium]